MWLGLTIARSSPASTQWCRKTELSTARGRGETPKETLETPSEVFTPGISALIRRIPSIVSTAEGFHSSSPVVRVKVSASKISASGSRPCSPQAMSRIRSAISTLRSAVFAIPTSSIVSAIRARAVRLGQRHDDVGLVAAGLEVDRVDDRPSGDLLQRRLEHLRLGRVDLDRRWLGQRDPLRPPPPSARPRPGARSAPRRRRARGRRLRPGLRRPGRGRRSRRRAAAPWPCASPAS